MKKAVLRERGVKPPDLRSFKRLIYDYYRKHGRSLPWRETSNAYHILVSELMLQQTQVNRVIEKYMEFIAEFPDAVALAKAPLRSVLTVWQGLGYNRRALALKKIALALVAQHRGKVPSSFNDLVKLPGVGKATASAILAFSFNQPVVFIETNIRTVFIHCFFPGQDEVSDEEIIPLVTKTLDAANPREWYYALMDYGTFLKKSIANPGRKSTQYQKQSPFDGSNRQVRGRILRYLTTEHEYTEEALAQQLGLAPGRVRSALHELVKEGMITRKGTMLKIG
jgi:A/G-specific adenine glycosylase